MNIYDNFDIIIGGDFNVDFRVNSLNLMFLNSFIEDEDLYTINNYMSNPNSFSYESNMGNKSLIDHFFISNNTKNKIGSCDILIDGSNLFDHNPIFMHLNNFFSDSLSCDNNMNENNDTYDVGWKRKCENVKTKSVLFSMYCIFLKIIFHKINYFKTITL